MKIHFASAMFLPMLAGFYIKRLSFYLGNLDKNLTRSKLVKLLLLLCISPRIRILCVQLLLYKFCCTNIVICNAMCSFLTSKIVLKIVSDALFEFKSKDKYERKMLSRLKRNFKREIYINTFCLMLQVLFFFGTSRWNNGKRMKQNKSCLKKVT